MMPELPSCFFCVNSAQSVQKYKIEEDCGDGNTIRYVLTYFFGHQIEPFINNDNFFCNNCMQFFKNMTYIKRRSLDIICHKYESPEMKAKDFNEIWSSFTNFASTLMKFNPNETNEAWDLDIHNRCTTPSPLLLKCEEPLRRRRKKSLKPDDLTTKDQANNNEDEEVQRYLKIRKLEYECALSKQMRRSARILNYNGGLRSISRSADRQSVPLKRSVSTQPAKKRRKVGGSRSVCQESISYSEPIVEDISKKFICEVCNISFKSLDNLTLHMVKLHKIEARFDCSQCSQSYVTRDHLKKHIKIHEPDVLHCFECRAEMNGIENLQDHLRQHLVCSYRCGHCYLSFLTFEEHSNHYKEEHSDKSETEEIQQRGSIIQSIITKRNIKLDHDTSQRKKTKDYKSIVLSELLPPPEIIVTPPSPITTSESDSELSELNHNFDLWKTSCRKNTLLVRISDVDESTPKTPTTKESKDADQQNKDSDETKTKQLEILSELNSCRLDEKQERSSVEQTASVYEVIEYEKLHKKTYASNTPRSDEKNRTSSFQETSAVYEAAKDHKFHQRTYVPIIRMDISQYLNK